MSIAVFYLLTASMFSLEGIGEDNSIFKDPFLGLKNKAHIEVKLCPEISILNSGGDFRGLFWTNPFHLKFAVPVTRGFILGIGNQTRFAQTFDLYYSEENLDIHLDGRGGIEEIYINLNNDFGLGEIALRGSYLLGNASEIWEYDIGNFYLIDSFNYKYEGKIFCVGFKLRAKSLFDISAFYEGYGDIDMETADSDSSIDLPDRVSLSLQPKAKFFNGFFTLTIEHSMWPETEQSDIYRSPYRFKLGFSKERFSFDYFFNPWYLKDVTEHGINISLAIPIRRLGALTFDIGCSMKNKETLREFSISPELKLVLSELFVKRHK